METAEAEIVEGTHKRDARGRMLTGGSERERVLEAFDDLGLGCLHPDTLPPVVATA